MAASISHVLLIMVAVMGSASTDESPDEVGELRDQLQLLNNRMLKQEIRNVDQEQQLLDQELKLMEQEDKIVEQEQMNVEQEQKLADQQWEISELKKQQGITTHTAGSPYAGVNGFSVHLPSGTYSAPGTIVFSEMDYIQGSGYDQTTGVYTAPVDGYYLFHGALAGSTSQTYVYLYLNGVAKQRFHLYTYYDYNTATLGGIFKLSVGDTVYLYSGHTIYCVNDTCHFDGYLLHEIL